MIGAITTLVIFILMTSIGLSIQEKNRNEVKVSSISFDRSDASKIAVSGINIAKDAVSSDKIWGDCAESEIYCRHDDYFPLYSDTLSSKMENYNLNSGKLTILIRPENSNYMRVIVKGDVNSRKVFFGVKFQKISSVNKVPLVYGGISNVRGGKVCSMYWNSRRNRVDGITRPNFSVYLDKDFYWNPEIYIPNHPSGNNPKDVKFTTNFSTEVKGYSLIDKVYSTGDVTLKNGAKVDLVYANGRVYTDETSSYGRKIENGNLQFPKFKTTFEDNYINVYSTRTVICRGVKYITSGVYQNIYIHSSCNLHITGDSVKIKNLVVKGRGRIYFSNPDTVLETENIVLNSYSKLKYTSENGRNSFITIRANNLFLGIRRGFWRSRGRAELICTDPLTCLIDVNNLTTFGFKNVIQGSIIARDRAYLFNSTVIGNLFAEHLRTIRATLCNVVDSEGNQLISRNYFDIIDPDRTVFPAVIQEIKRVVCNNISDCDEKLN